MNRRKLILATALLGSLAWTAWTLVFDQGPEIVGATVRQAAQHAARAATPGGKPRLAHLGDSSPALQLPQRLVPERQSHNLFGGYSYAPPAAPVAAAAPAPPEAPPLPFKFAGFLLDGDHALYWLARGDDMIDAQIGTHIGDFTLVEADAGQLVFLHEPTGQKVVMPIPVPTTETASAD